MRLHYGSGGKKKKNHYMYGISLFNDTKFRNCNALMFLDKASLSLVLSQY